MKPETKQQPQIRVLGPPELRSRDGAVVHLRRKPLELMSMLVMAPNAPLSADRLRDGLWGDNPPTTAETALRVHLSELRKALRFGASGVSRLSRTPYGYIITVEDGDLDADHFDRAVIEAEHLETGGRIDALGEALRLWRGEPFEGLDDLPGVVAVREALQRRRLHGCTLLGDALLETRRFDALATEAARWSVDFPTAEAVARLRALASYHGGDHVMAARVVRTFSRELREGYGVEPTAQLSDLEHRILTQAVPLIAPSRPSRSAVQMGTTLVERDAVIRETMDWLKASDEQGCVLVITGEPGLGKTSVVEHLRSGLTGSILLRGRRSGEPLSTVDDLAVALLPAGVARALPKSQLAHGEIAAQLLPALRDTYCVIVVDDVDHVDPDSTSVLRRLIEHGVGTWITTIRSQGLGDHPLLAEREVLGRAHVLRLTPLTQDGTLALARRCGWDPGEDRDIDLLLSATAGNPFLIAALSRWRHHGGAIEEVPPHVTEHVRRMLDDLAPRHRAIIHIAALATDEAIDRTLIGSAIAATDDEVLEGAEVALGLGILVDIDGSLRFRHRLLRDAVADSITEARRRKLHADTARGLLASGVEWSRPLAHHLRLSRAPELAAATARATAREAEESLAVGAPLGAIALFDDAIAVGAAAGIDELTLTSWGLVRCDALAASGRLVAAQESAQHLAESARRLSSLELFTRAARSVAGPFIPTGEARQSGAPLLLEALDWCEHTAQTPEVALCEAIARITVTEQRDSRATALARVRPLLVQAAADEARPAQQGLACLGLRAIAWSTNEAAFVRSELAWRAADAAGRASDGVLALHAEHALAGDLFSAGSDRASVALDRYAASASAAGSALHRWLAARIRLTWALATGRADLAGSARDEARALNLAIDATTRADADLGTIVAEQIRGNRLAALGGQQPTHAIDVEFGSVVALATGAIAAANGESIDAAMIGRALADATGSPFAAPAGAFAALALRGAACGDDQLGVGRQIVDVLAPHTGEVVLVDSGLSCLGPADGYLAVAFDVLGAGPAAAYHRHCAAELARRVAPGWTAWVEGVLK